MDLRELAAYIDRNYQQLGDTLFRMEVLPEYLVGSDGDDFRRWLDGATEPTWGRKQPWLDQLAADAARGLRSSRLRIFSEHLTDYERYACDFGYAYNARYEDIRVLRRGEHDIPHELIETDFWLIGDSRVALMHYDELGRFEVAERIPVSRARPYTRTRDLGMAAAEPFTDWWARHPELHRRLVA